MPKLNQIIAIEKGVKNQQNQIITEAHQLLLKKDPLDGISRSYRPKTEDGEALPGESKNVQVKAHQVLSKVADAWAELVNITLTKDSANASAKADIVVDGSVILPQVPVTTLLWLEKQLVDLHTVVKKLPTLDPAENWSLDEAQNVWATQPYETARTKKVMRNHVKAAATDKFPAQVDTYTEDEIVGYWKTVKFSGAIPVKRREDLLERVEKLQRAVKFAREEANSAEATVREGGKKLFEFILA